MRRGADAPSLKSWVSDVQWCARRREKLLYLHVRFTHTLSDEDDMQAEFVKTMNAIAEGIPKDIQKATDDDTFERKSRDLVTLYRWVCPSNA